MFPKNTERILGMQLDVLVFVGDTQNVSAAISSSAVYMFQRVILRNIQKVRTILTA